MTSFSRHDVLPASCIGILALALPISVIGTNFSERWTEHQKKVRAGTFTAVVPPRVKEMLEWLETHMLSMEDLMRIFKKVGTGNGNDNNAQMTEASAGGQNV